MAAQSTKHIEFLLTPPPGTRFTATENGMALETLRGTEAKLAEFMHRWVEETITPEAEKVQLKVEELRDAQDSNQWHKSEITVDDAIAALAPPPPPPAELNVLTAADFGFVPPAQCKSCGQADNSTHHKTLCKVGKPGVLSEVRKSGVFAFNGEELPTIEAWIADGNAKEDYLQYAQDAQKAPKKEVIETTK